MASPSPVLLILGSGKRVGKSVAQAFAAKGYKVALASRGQKEADSTADQVNISADFSDPESIVGVFSKVKQLLGTPSVVVYNAGAVSWNGEKDSFSISLEDFQRDFNINTTSAFVAAQESVRGFAQLPTSAAKTFIFTGNCLNNSIIPKMMDAGMGKSATAHMIQVAAEAYKDQGFKFYYGDERKADGAPAFMDVNGDAHGQHYLSLAEGKSQGPWQQTFVKGVGYKQF